MRISLSGIALIAALCCILCLPGFATDMPDTAEPDILETETPAEPEGALPGRPPETLPETPPEEPGESVPGVEGSGELVLEAEDPGEELETLSPEELEMTVYYDERTGADYVEIRTPEKIEEYHYLSHIRYSDLIYVLSDLLRRITRDGYRWSSVPEISYEKNDEVALLYRRDLVTDMVFGIVQFPDFKVFLSAAREADEEHRFNAENGRDMMTLVFSFAACLAQAEQTLGIKQLDYTMRFFKQD